jgi:hypothetical protein
VEKAIRHFEQLFFEEGGLIMRKNLKVLFILLAIIMPFFTLRNQKAAATEQTYLNVVNPLTGDQWFNFTALEKSVGDTFIINITITNVTNLFCWEFMLDWNSNALSYVSAWLPSDNVFAGQMPVIAGPDASVAGQMIYGAAAGPNQPGFNGSGTLAQVELRIVQGGGESLISFAEIYDYTFLSDYYINNIPFTAVNGYYAYPLGPLIQNVFGTPSVPNYDQSVQIEALVSDNAGVESVFVHCNYGNSSYNITMANNGGNNFTASIPPLPFNTTVSYSIFAMNTNQHWAKSDRYSYTVTDFVPPGIAFVDWKPTCPYPYVPSNATRANEPICVTTNVSEPIYASGVAIVLLSYRADAGEWWNTTMTFNTTSGLWTSTIPGQQGSSTIDLFISTCDAAGNWATSSLTSFIVKPLPLGDVNGDGVTNMRDIAFLVLHFNERILELAIFNFNQHK